MLWVYSSVEREPMWDGNLTVIILHPPFLRVEREPMWDGNLKR